MNEVDIRYNWRDFQLLNQNNIDTIAVDRQLITRRNNKVEGNNSPLCFPVNLMSNFAEILVDFIEIIDRSEIMKRIVYSLPAVVFVFLYSYGRLLLFQNKNLDVSFSKIIFPILMDVVVAVLLLVILYLLVKMNLIIPYVFALTFVTLHLSNMEYIFALDNVINLKDISLVSDKEFLKGTFSHLNFPMYSLSIVITLILTIFIFHKIKIAVFKKKVFDLLALFVLGSLYFITAINSSSDWQDGNFISASISNSKAHLLSENKTDAKTSYPADIEQLVNTTQKLKEGEYLLQNHITDKKNVLIVVMEGIPGAYLPASQNFLDTYNDIRLKSINKIASHSLIVPNFITHNNQTIRGMYSMLSGDYPKLDASTPEAYDYLQNTASERNPLLAKLLKDRGYNTEFIQAASLEYMSKGDFMKAAGFDTIIGTEGFPIRYVPFGWGPDDKAFLEQAQTYLNDLDNKGQPWFATLLTVGTHHPYAVTDEMEKKSSSRKVAAVDYLDESLSEFIDYINNSGFADDTLVLFVSDESHGVNDQPYGSNWGFLAAYSPDIEGQIINDGVYGHKDIVNSIIDYVDPDLDPSTIGRSIFRKYTEESPILFASHYNGDIFFSKKKGEVYQLDNKGKLYVIKSENGELFSSKYTKLVINDDNLISEILLYKNYINEPSGNEKNIIIAEDKDYTIANGKLINITDGQFITLPAESYVDINVSYEFVSPEANDYLTFYMDEYDNKINKAIVDENNPKGKLKYRFYNKEIRAGYNFSINIIPNLVSELNKQVKISDLNIEFSKENTDINSEINMFTSYNRVDINELHNLIPFMSFQGGANKSLADEVNISSKENNILIYGPYIPYKRGQYILNYTFRVNSEYLPTDEIFTLDVTSDGGANILTEKTIKLQDMNFDGEEYTAAIPFSVSEDLDGVELRLKAKRDLEITVTEISTEMVVN
ncbi:LTA synthase family protein [Paenibacillus glacialis]|uniref:Sulfatase N-terminal domain-containing protein n=1 Tax=Paenibacillus glacialis TaxID=494026 RepID=A0A168L7T9_9BACL|nr:LTA synthase family protein [Paenibacillus glacialis]OAB42997.1 hypothetical protein PGLA_11140 [Paenibacillus glacialis]